MMVRTPHVGDHAGQIVNEDDAKQEAVELRKVRWTVMWVSPRIRIEGAKNGQDKARLSGWTRTMKGVRLYLVSLQAPQGSQTVRS